MLVYHKSRKVLAWEFVLLPVEVFAIEKALAYLLRQDLHLLQGCLPSVQGHCSQSGWFRMEDALQLACWLFKSLQRSCA